MTLNLENFINLKLFLSEVSKSLTYMDSHVCLVQTFHVMIYFTTRTLNRVETRTRF